MGELAARWDDAKQHSNLAKHGLDFRRARTIFDGRPRLDIGSPRQDGARVQPIAVLNGRMVTVIWTQRSKDTIRIISIRRARCAAERQYRQARARAAVGEAE
jgi:uncharacterized DUF497 family protein